LQIRGGFFRSHLAVLPYTGSPMDNSRVFAMKFSGVYPMYVQKAVKKNRTQA
jgi:hypothetical protein